MSPQCESEDCDPAMNQLTAEARDGWVGSDDWLKVEWGPASTDDMSSNREVRLAAAQALGFYGLSAAQYLDTLEQTVEREVDPLVKSEIGRTTGAIRHSAAATPQRVPSSGLKPENRGIRQRTTIP